jgi:hypothetical protein
MLLELITPLMLTTAPVQIDLPPQIKYDHVTQQSIQLSEYKNQTSYTYGTQTGVPDPYKGQKDQDTD